MTENTTGSNEPDPRNPERVERTESAPVGGSSGSAGEPSPVDPEAREWPTDAPPRPAPPVVAPSTSSTTPIVRPSEHGVAASPAPVGSPERDAFSSSGGQHVQPGAASRPRNHEDWHPHANTGAPTTASRDAFGNPTFGVPASSTRTTTKRRGSTMLVAGLAIGALVGGASGAGTFALVNGMQSPNSVVSNAGGSQNVTINDTDAVNRTTAVAAKASPSVVTIAVAGSEGAGTGSGIILSEDGYVLTNNHVVTLDGSVTDPTIQVTDNDGRINSASIVGTDPAFDLAVIKLDDASGLTPMEIADSSKLNVGDTVVAIGAPLGLAGTVTDGIVSALNRSITVASSAVPDTSEGQDGTEDGDRWGFEIPGQEDQGAQGSASISLPVVQTDAAINPGNSGGALVDDNGRLIGVNVAIASAGNSSSEQSGSIGVGFAIPSNVAERIATEIIDQGEASHGLLGATVGDASAVEGSDVAGAVINEVTDGGAARDAGIRSGDVVTSFNGVPITGATDLTAQVRALAAGSTASVVYQRDGEEFTVDVTLGELQL